MATPAPKRRAAVVVLGDVGRSPRMQYHALSLANQAGMDVDIIGYGGSTPHEALLRNPRIHLHLMAPSIGSKLPRLLYLLLLPLKLLLQICGLLKALCFTIPRPDFFLVQNPPSIPVLTVVQLACWLRGASLIIDWHNFGYTLLGLRLGPSHPLVLIHRWYERRYGRRANAHLCVTKAMQQELRVNWGIRATVLYDRPPDFFRPATLEEKHELFLRLRPELAAPAWSEGSQGLNRVPPAQNGRHQGGHPQQQDLQREHPHSRRMGPNEHLSPSAPPNGDHSPLAAEPWPRPRDWLELSASQAEEQGLGRGQGRGRAAGPRAAGGGGGEPGEEMTLLTVRRRGEEPEGASIAVVEERGDRPAVVVSSTSWSADEDFGMLLEAALMYDRRVAVLLGEKDEDEDEAEDKQEGGGTLLGGPKGESEASSSSPSVWEEGALASTAGHSADAGRRQGQIEARGERDPSVEEEREEPRSAGAEGAPPQEERERRERGAPPLQRFARLLFLVTGKGPLRRHWEQKMSALRLKRVAFRTLWLSAEDYPRLLGCADLGVSLHTSSSGLDLPMKVVDMFGCSLPVCALAYSCIGELVKERVNGLLFSSSSDLASQLMDLFRGFPFSAEDEDADPKGSGGAREGPILASLRQGAAAAAASSRWADEWAQHVLPLVKQLSGMEGS